LTSSATILVLRKAKEEVVPRNRWNKKMMLCLKRQKEAEEEEEEIEFGGLFFK